MKINKNIVISGLLIMVFILCSAIEAEAQRRGSKKRTRDRNEDTRNSRRDRDEYDLKTWKDNLYYEFHFGNINWFNDQLNASAKPAVGYNFNSFLSANLGLKGAYVFLNQPAGIDDINLFDWGVAPAIRAKFLENFYIQAEYSFNSFNIQLPDGSLFKRKKWAPFIGGGYLSGVGPNRFGFQLLFIADNEYRDTSIITNIPIEFWIGFYKNF